MTPEQRAHDRAAPAGDGHAADNHGGDHLQLHADAGVARDLIEADGIEQRGAAGERAGQREDPEHDARGLDAGKPRAFGVRPGGVHGASRGQMAQRPRRRSAKQRGDGNSDRLADGLRLAEALEIGRQVLHPCALRDPAQAVAQRHHRRERDDDRRDPEPRDQRAVERAEQRAGKTRRRARQQATPAARLRA